LAFQHFRIQEVEETSDFGIESFKLPVREIPKRSEPLGLFQNSGIGAISDFGIESFKLLVREIPKRSEPLGLFWSSGNHKGRGTTVGCSLEVPKARTSG
jgi:hypothetical protein